MESNSGNSQCSECLVTMKGDNEAASDRNLQVSFEDRPCHQQFTFINGIGADGRSGRYAHKTIRSHAMTVVHHRKRQTKRDKHIQAEASPPNIPSSPPSTSSMTEKLNDGAFSLALVELSRQQWDTAENYINFVFPSFWGRESLRDITSPYCNTLSLFPAPHKEAARQRKAICLTDPLHKYATLAASISALMALDHSNNAGLVSIFMELALASLRQRCGQPASIDYDVVFSMASLCRAEISLCNYEAALAHMSMVRYMYDRLDGHKTFPVLLTDVVLLSDKHIALELFQSPVFPCNFDPGPAIWPSLSRRRRLPATMERAFNTMGSLFMSGNALRMLGAELCSIVHDLRDCILTALDVYYCSDNEHVETTYTQWFFRRTTAITYRLLSLSRNAHGSEAESNAQSAVQVSLVVWISLITSHGLGWPSRAKWVTRLETCLRACVEQTSEAQTLDPPVLLWMANLGASVATNEPDSRDWFISSMKCLAKHLGISTSKEATQDILEGCFHLRSLQDSALAVNIERLADLEIRGELTGLSQSYAGMRIGA